LVLARSSAATAQGDLDSLCRRTAAGTAHSFVRAIEVAAKANDAHALPALLVVARGGRE
jgi:hypothetical protein